MRDYTKRYKDWARFIPAISTFYTKTLGCLKKDNSYLTHSRPNGLPIGMELDFDGLNFLDPDKSYFHESRKKGLAGS